MNIAYMLKDLEKWCKEVIIRFNHDYKWTGLIIANDGFSANWQEHDYGELVFMLWKMAKERSKKSA